MVTAGGNIVEAIHVPFANPAFAPFLQRASDAKPDAIFVFLPAGQGGVFAKEFVERGINKSGIRLISMSDLMDDDLLKDMGDSVLRVVSGGPYSISPNSKTNEDFVKGFRAANDNRRPNTSPWPLMTAWTFCILRSRTSPRPPMAPLWSKR